MGHDRCFISIPLSCSRTSLVRTSTRERALCVSPPPSLFDVEREESLLDRTRHGLKARCRDAETPPAVRRKRLYEAMQTSHYTKVQKDSNPGIQRHKNPKRNLKEVRKSHSSTIRSISDCVTNVLLNKSLKREVQQAVRTQSSIKL